MSDIPEIVNLDDCSMKPALIAGSVVAAAFTLVPMSYAVCCLPLVLGGFVGTTVFIFKHRVRLELKFGMKIGILACLLGFGASTLLYDILWAAFDYRIGFEAYIGILETFIDQVVSLAGSDPSSTREQLDDSIEMLREQSIGIGIVIQQIFTIILTSGIGGAIGGALATSFFKKGAIAR